MTGEKGTNAAHAAAPLKKDEPISLSEFLAMVAPSSWRNVTDLWEQKWTSGGGNYTLLTQPDIVIHCADEICGGPRTFRSISRELIFRNNEAEQDFFLDYICSNCHKSAKRFAVRAVRAVVRAVDGAGEIYKYGEEPPFGPPTPPRLIRLFGDERDLFFKGRRCETQGLGIGAFVYYRRIVENHKDELFAQIIKVAEQVGIGQEKNRYVETRQGGNSVHRSG